jgi:hypothetical protein
MVGRVVTTTRPPTSLKQPLGHTLMLAQVMGMIEAVGLRVGIIDRDFGEGGLGENLLGDILDRANHDLVNETDIGVLARGDPRDHLAPGHLGIDHGLPAAAAVVDHDDEILHAGRVLPIGIWPCGRGTRPWRATARSVRGAT